MAGNSKNPPVVSPDDQADHLQKLIRERFEIITNFADVAKQAQALAKIFQTYDEDKSGSLEFEEFDRVLADIRCNQAPEPTRRALFDRYDADLDGNVNLQELMDGVFELKPHPLAKKENRKMLADIRGQITRRGGMNGIRSLGRIFKIMDDTGNGKISHEEFLYGLHDMGVDIPKSEVAIALDLFDRDKDGTVNFNEFLVTVRGKLNPRRLALVELAWDVFDKADDGVVSMQDLMHMYDVSQHPDVVDGKMTPEEAVADFAKQWDKDSSGSIVRDEFVEYYKDVSASIDDDRYFELMIRNAWHITGGEGQAENTANLRVLVTFEDGSQDIVTVEDDLGVRRDDFPLIRKRLFMQGVRGVVNISLSD